MRYLTVHEVQQSEAKRQESYSSNTYCGQCGDIIKQSCPWYTELIIGFLTLGFYRAKAPQTYKCLCWWRAVSSPSAQKLLENFGG